MMHSIFELFKTKIRIGYENQPIAYLPMGVQRGFTFIVAFHVYHNFLPFTFQKRKRFALWLIHKLLWIRAQKLLSTNTEETQKSFQKNIAFILKITGLQDYKLFCFIVEKCLILLHGKILTWGFSQKTEWARPTLVHLLSIALNLFLKLLIL